MCTTFARVPDDTVTPSTALAAMRPIFHRCRVNHAPDRFFAKVTTHAGAWISRPNALTPEIIQMMIG
jgi:hypothetical protein